jgi:hypothetical protein
MSLFMVLRICLNTPFDADLHPPRPYDFGFAGV